MNRISCAEWHKFGGYSLTGQWDPLNALAEARMTTAELRTSCAETDPQNLEACVRRETAEAGKTRALK